MKIAAASKAMLTVICSGAIVLAYQNCSRAAFNYSPLHSKGEGLFEVVIPLGDSQLDAGESQTGSGSGELPSAPGGSTPPDDGLGQKDPDDQEGEPGGGSGQPSGGDAGDPDGGGSDTDTDHIIATCDNLEIKDIFVQVRAITAGKAQLSLIGSQLLNLMDLNAGVQITSDRKEKSNMLFIEVAEGSYVVDQFDRKFALKTPSANESGLKINFGKP